MLWNPQRGGGGPSAIVDSFEDNDISEYSGATSDYATVDDSGLSWTAPDGSYVLEQQSGASFARIVSESGDGLANYFPKGNTAEADIRSETLDGSLRVIFGAGSVFNSYYAAEVDYGSGELRILDRDGGGTLNELASTTLSPSTDTTGTVRIVWDDGTLGGADNDITVSYSEGGSELDSLSVNDSSHATNEGVGVAVQGGTGGGRFVDYYRLL